MQRDSAQSARWTRLVLLCVILASVAIAIVDRMRAASSQRSPLEPASTLALHLHESQGYGNPTLRIGAGAEQPLPASSAAVDRAVQQAIQSANCSSLLLRVSGGVRQGEVQRVRDAIIRAAGNQKVDIYVVLADELPEVFGRSDARRSAGTEEQR
jgi:hypothetical protein